MVRSQKRAVRDACAPRLWLLRCLDAMATAKKKQDDALRFEGFHDAEGKFFKALAKNQKKEWFEAHKEDFETGWNAPMLALMTELYDRIDGAYPDVELTAPKRFRIYRDVRFSKDKSPYKTHVAGVIGVKTGKEGMGGPAALYFHVGEADYGGATSGPFAGAGVWMTDPPALAKLRAAIVDDESGAELAKLLKALEKKGYAKDAHQALARVPRGFDAEHPRAELLKLKGLIVSFPKAAPSLLTSRKLVDHLATQARAVAPLVRWLTFATQ